jgi:glycosyltransferase involved in cell wall biosynthesis
MLATRFYAKSINVIEKELLVLLSIFTPTNDTKYLKEVYDSLAKQDHQDWEWIIGLNGGAHMPSDEVFLKDARIKPFTLHAGTSNIGALKYACCQRATGEMLVELDHDDLLWPGVLTAICKKAAQGADFVFSDAASYDEDAQKPVWFNGDHGWETYPAKLYGQSLAVTRNFPITARSLCEVYYAPDHIRCWRRSFYNSIGGHDVTLSVGDDHDLICRSYIAHGKFLHTGTVGYIYRFHPNNTVKARNAQIQVQTQKNRMKYLHKLIDEWTARERLQFLDLEKHIEWMDNMPELQHTKTNSVGCIRAYGSLPWIPQEKVPQVFEEFYRVLAPGGWLCCQAYSTDGPGAFVPTAHSYWNELTFEYFCNKKKALEIQPYRGRFQKVQCWTAFAKPKVDKPLRRKSVYADLCAIKDQRQPGLVFI